MGALPPRKVWEFEARIMVASHSGRPHRWVVEFSFHREIRRKHEPLVRYGLQRFSTRAKWRFLKIKSAQAQSVS
jgi:hypothetical protein